MDSSTPGRRSIRLRHYDYSQPGYYFITICCQNKVSLFGSISSGEIKLNAAGNIIAKWYYKLESKFTAIKCHDVVIMPNHFHCVIEIISNEGGHADPPLPVIIQWFKTMTTNDYIKGVKNNGWATFDRRLWQRNYYEHVIRNEESYSAIAEYIQTNPAKWREDKYYTPDP